MKKLLLITILIGGCATTYSPEQLQAKASDKSDVDLCFDMVLPNPNQYSKQELMNRGVNCNSPDIANTVIEKRQQQIRTAQMLMAFGNAILDKKQKIRKSIWGGAQKHPKNEDNQQSYPSNLMQDFNNKFMETGLIQICILTIIPPSWQRILNLVVNSFWIMPTK